MHRTGAFLLLLTGGHAFGQSNPVISLRSVVNAVTLQPAPSRSAPGGIVWISGLNLGPAEGATAPGIPLPTELGGTQVLVNNRPAPLFSVTPNRITAQIPWETQNGLATVLVRRNGASSRSARITIGPTPAVRTANAEGWGPIAGANASEKLSLSATGFAPLTPRPASGELTPAGVEFGQNVRVYVGGRLAASTVRPSETKVGEFDIEVSVPSLSEAGDTISVIAGNNAANRSTLGLAGASRINYVRVPGGTAAISAMTVSDLRPGYAVLNSVRDAQGCYASFRVDVKAGVFAAEPGCLVAPNNNAPTPFSAPVDSNVIAALEGPAQGQAPNGVSSKMRLFNPDLEKPMTVEFPSLASNILGSVDGNVIVRFATDPATAVVVDSVSGEQTPTQIGAAVGGGGAGGGPGGIGALLQNLQVDLGDGIKQILSNPVAAGQNILLIVGDDASQPTKAKLATLNARGEVTGSRDFPPGYLPLMTPAPPPPANLPPGVNFIQQPARAAGIWDGPTQTHFVLARKVDSSADAILGFEANSVRVIESPAFFSNCSTPARIFTFELTRKLAFLGSTAADRTIRTPCAASSYLVFDLDGRTLEGISLPGSGQLNASGQMGDLSDYVWGLNLDPSRPNVADTLYVLDGATTAAFRFDLPAGVSGFSNPQPLAATNSLVALATNRVQGDDGILVFDIESASARFLPTPEGFATVQLAGTFPAVRKLIARGNRPNNTGSQVLIYDLTNGDLSMPANPEGCVFVGVLPQAAGGGGGGGGAGGQQGIAQLFNANPRSNTITAGCYGENRQLHGVMLVAVQ